MAGRRPPYESMWIRNLAAFTQALGVENAPTVFALATLGWENDNVRDAFIKDLSGVDFAELNVYG